MQIDIVNGNNEKVGAIELSDDVFGGRIKTDLIWESVVQEQAAKRRGTHATKNRALVSGGGKKPYKQKGTGRPQVGSSRTPLWRKGGTVFGPQPRTYEFSLPKKVVVGAVRAALAQKLSDGAVVVVDRLEAPEGGKTKGTAEMLKRLGATGKTLVIDVTPADDFAVTARNIAGVRLVPSARVTARDIMDTTRVIATREAIEKLQESLG
ncbi:MAG: 50S ribosomal protein L4 [Acidobacteria bacterium RIFCSPLOWO2_02_FULL_67_36]|nr:MAG: 50S ribosomal protein L4 [Acidobacteria bacterium RIFCSPLOWO2_02_FULL_67_36]OFW21231.1 MAG: 50S ribosomal protein L4 [Acidobacteria bacterium RIFCSPLOWO2_12_FULL_66_21]